jgi:preprotein translocase subunit SecD
MKKPSMLTKPIYLAFSCILFLCCTNGDSRQKTKHSAISNSEENLYLNSETNHNDSILSTGWYYIADTNTGYHRQLDKDQDYYFINPKPIVTAKDFKRLEIYKMKEKGFGLEMQLDEEATKLWSIVTRRLSMTGQKLAFILNDNLLIAPRVLSQITNGMTAINRSDYTKEELKRFKAIIESQQK